jgi:type IV pilus assembly protein PilQ
MVMGGKGDAGDRRARPSRGVLSLGGAGAVARAAAPVLALGLVWQGTALAGGGAAPAAAAGGNQIVQVDSSAEGQATWIRMRGTRAPRFDVSRLENPERVVIDVPDSRLAPALRASVTAGAAATWSVNSLSVERVTAQEGARGGAASVRVVVWLARPSTYRVATEGRDLVVRLTAREATAPPGTASQPVAVAGTGAASRVAAAKRADKRAAADVDDDVAAAEKAASRLRADATAAVSKARSARRAANHALRGHRRSAYRLRMTARKLEESADEKSARAEAAERELARLRADASDEGDQIAAASAPAADAPSPRAPSRTISGPALRPVGNPPTAAAPSPGVSPAPSNAQPSNAQPSNAQPSNAQPSNAQPSNVQPSKGQPGQEPARRAPVATDYPSPEVAGFGGPSGPITQQTVAQVQQHRRKVYRGRKIDLDLKDADVHNLMRLLADVGGINIVVPDNVKASITVRLRDVPWDQAMEVILASKGLWYRREGGLVRVAPRKELDAEDQAESERIRALAESEAPETQVFTLNYAVAGKVREQLTPLLSPKGRIEVDDRTNSLIINDISAHRRRIIGLVTQLDYQTPQIQIEARVVEARTNFNRDFGIQWGGSVSATAAGGNSTGLVFPNSVVAAGGNDGPPAGGVRASPSDFAVNLPASTGPGVGGAIGLSLGSVGGNVNLNLRLSAAEETGTIRIISAPRITTSNNIEASIKSGTSIPVSVTSANGVQTQFVPADLLLRVTPAVSQRDCAVSMQVHVTKNEADFVNTGARGDPSILTKEAKTTILVADGQTAVIGGIYTRNTGLGYHKVPFLAEIPVLGWLFKNRQENDDRTEVLVFITPKITNRAFLRCQ